MSAIDIQKKIEKLYQNSGYMDRYGSDMWTSAIICFIFIFLTFYYHYMNVLKVVKANWETERCNPAYIGFAGIINKPDNMTGLEYTAGNFSDCINSFLKYVVEIAVQPFQYAILVLQDAAEELIASVNSYRSVLKSFRGYVSTLINKIYAGLTNFMVSFIEVVVKTKDSLGKINGILTTSLYTLFGGYMAMQSLFLIIIDMIIMILIIVAMLIVVFIATAICLYCIPFFGAALASPSVISAITTSVIMLAILIPCIMFEMSMLRIMDMSTPPPPGIPGCFTQNTLMEMADGSSQKIKDIQLGDKLKNGSSVTAIILFDATEQNIYKLHEVFVTGEHRVFHPEKKWIKVKDHPDSVYMPLFHEPYVYCLNTDNKMFTIGETIFSDWDDIDENVLADLRENCVSVGYLPENFTFADIHTHLDSGFHRETQLTLHNGKTVPIVDIEVNDILITGEKVLGLIIISAYDMDVYKYSFADGKYIYGSQNIHINDPNLGILNGFKLVKERCEGEMCLFHLLTDSKFFTANNIRVNDYNSGIDRYLRG